MARSRPPRRTQRQLPASRRPAVRPAPSAARPPFRTAWASTAEGGDAGEAIGKVVRFGDAPRVGRVRDVVFETETGDILAYVVDPGDGSDCFVPAGELERETPSTLHFSGHSATPFGGAATDEFLTLEHFPDSEER